MCSWWSIFESKAGLTINHLDQEAVGSSPRKDYASGIDQRKEGVHLGEMKIMPETQPRESHAAKFPKAGDWGACWVFICREQLFCTENMYRKLNGKPVHCWSEWRSSLNLLPGDRKIHRKQYFKGMGISYRNAQNFTERVGREKT